MKTFTHRQKYFIWLLFVLAEAAERDGILGQDLVEHSVIAKRVVEAHNHGVVFLNKNILVSIIKSKD